MVTRKDIGTQVKFMGRDTMIEGILVAVKNRIATVEHKVTGKYETFTAYVPVVDVERATPKCWCGAPMLPAGNGAYPYDCEAKDKRPNDMVYVGCEAGHSGWTTAHSVTVERGLRATLDGHIVYAKD